MANWRVYAKSNGCASPPETCRSNFDTVSRPAEAGNELGQALVLAAKEILKRAGCGILEITSNERLVGAHQFYQHLGYDRTSIRLAKKPLEVIKCFSREPYRLLPTNTSVLRQRRIELID